MEAAVVAQAFRPARAPEKLMGRNTNPVVRLKPDSTEESP